MRFGRIWMSLPTRVGDESNLSLSCHTVGSFLPCLGTISSPIRRGKYKRYDMNFDDQILVVLVSRKTLGRLGTRLLLLCATKHMLHCWGTYKFPCVLQSILWIWWQYWLRSQTAAAFWKRFACTNGGHWSNIFFYYTFCIYNLCKTNWVTLHCDTTMLLTNASNFTL